MHIRIEAKKKIMEKRKKKTISNWSKNYTEKMEVINSPKYKEMFSLNVHSQVPNNRTYTIFSRPSSPMYDPY